MKKSLVIVPLIALVLVGCTSTKKKSSKKKSSSAQISSKTSSKTGQSSVAPLGPQDALDFGPETFGNYKRVMHAPENDKEYLFGFYHVDKSEFYFMNGHHHTDTVTNKDGTTELMDYPFYQSTTTDITKAVKLVCHYAADNEHYSIQIKGGGEFNTYDGKYLEIYEGEKDEEHGNEKVATIRHVDSPVEQFYYSEVEGNCKVSTSAIKFEHTVSSSGVGVFGCSGAKYVTVSALDQPKMPNGYICHFWEPIA